MDEQFNLTSLLLGLSEIEGNYSGPSLAKLFFKIINQYNLEDRMFGLTTDNASVNHRMAMAIETKVPTFCVKTHSVGCMAHKLHLAARDGLNALGVKNSPPHQPSTIHNPNPMSISNVLNYLMESICNMTPLFQEFPDWPHTCAKAHKEERNLLQWSALSMMTQHQQMQPLCSPMYEKGGIWLMICSNEHYHFVRHIINFAHLIICNNIGSVPLNGTR
ncbi:hypothetical protein O181_077914 [Austropuccinia psidii MF-1]|uniref:Uncharacterized protein n=1 Tax=Austropuccinia psidii MF-1 TaxID=1389203 RepID=A0A9Q3FFG5_9BASI|nr:hypothetical protein [Austropuccinia psidii MF-1]